MRNGKALALIAKDNDQYVIKDWIVYAAAATAGALLIGLFTYFHILNEINSANNVVILKFDKCIYTI